MKFCNKLLSLLVVFGIISCLISCKGKDRESVGDKAAPGVSKSEPVSKKGSKRNTPQLTSEEAVTMAYEKAKAWRKDAVLWWTAPTHLDYRCSENDLAWEWSAIFVNKNDNQRFNVKMTEGQIKSAVEEKYVQRKLEVLPEYPKDRTGVTLKKAIAAAVAAGAPAWEVPMVYYNIEGNKKAFNGMPLWSFVYSAPMVLIDVDGLTGKLLEVRDFDGKPLTLEQLKSRSFPDKEEAVRQNNFIFEFFEQIDNGKLDQAISKMDQAMAPDEQSRKMWKDSFASLELIKVKSVRRESESKWNNHMPLHKVYIYARPKAGSQYMGWEQGDNTRWISLKKEGSSWKIASISTSP